MKVIGFYKNENNGLLLELDNKGKILLQLWKDGLIRVRYTWKESFGPDKGYVVTGSRDDRMEWRVSEDAHSIYAAAGQIKLVINKDTAAFSWYGPEGELLVREPERGGKWLEETDVEGYDFEDAERVNMDLTGFSFNSSVRGGKKKFLRKAYSTKLELVFSEGEAIYGLGQHEEGILNYRGHSQTLYQNNRKLPMPVFISSKGYAFFFNTSSFSAFHDDAQGTYFWSEVCEELDYFFMYGPEFDAIVALIRSLTGKSSMLPMWAYGFWQSKEYYKTQEELTGVAREYRRRSIPIDVVVQDWRYWPGDQWGEKRFDHERYPDPEGMVKELHEMDIKLVISIWSHFNNLGPNHKEMLDKGLLLANGCNIDMFKEEARQLHWKQIQEGLHTYGIDGWWCDGTEPFDGMRPARFREEYFKCIGMDIEEYKRYMDPEFINLYPLLNSMGMYEGMRSAGEDKRVLNLTRACYPGQQRYGTVVWSGDVAANWEVLRRHIANGLNFCITGHSNWTLDIGAFFSLDYREICWWHAGDYPMGIEDYGYRELYVRWFQFGAFLPVFRSHGTDFSKEIWRFGEPGDLFHDILVKFDHLRYRLLPYIYSVVGMVTHKDYTMMRSLGFDFRHDPKVSDITGQYMFGPVIMVCPVTWPMYYGKDSKKLEGIAKSREVYLPEGCDWYDFWTGKRYGGGRSITADAQLDQIPLFVKAGSILPMSAQIQHSGEMWTVPWEIRVYPGRDGSFEIYEDAGDGYGYEKGEFAWTGVAWKDREGKLEISQRTGSYPGIVPERKLEIILVKDGHGTGLEREETCDMTIAYKGKSHCEKL